MKIEVECEVCPAAVHHIHGREEILSNQRLNGEEL